ncbi:SDR family NAD(P)-dependent oxidoreductase [Methylocella sp.]|uniref:SDR family NAD(P)-dependent oxidoreductase n=1 Tax=Methylocella sp. TaxID=1978226 RepID=UPI0035AF981E
MPDRKIALVAGASRGIGLGLVEAFLARGWRVIGTQRGASATGLAALPQERLVVETLDVADPASVEALRLRLSGGRLDALFVNAGILDEPQKPIGETDAAVFLRLMEVNAFGALRVVEALHALAPDGSVVGAMSSGLGSLARNESGGYEAYRASKAALNMMMRSFSARAGKGRAAVVIDPGWVRTDMGGSEAPLSVADSAPKIVDVLIGEMGRSGPARFLNYRGETVPW